MIGNRHPQKGRAGFSLVEVLVSIGMLGILFGAIGLAQIRNSSEAKVMRARGIAEVRAHQALERVASELTGVGRSLMFPDPNTSFGAGALTYQRPAGVSGAGLVQWNTPSRLELLPEPREVDNGIDDDGDGLVDERRLMYTRDIGAANERTVVLCSGIPELAPGELTNGLDDNGNGAVDEAGFNVLRTGDLLTVRITIQQPVAGDQIETVSAETSVVLHN